MNISDIVMESGVGISMDQSAAMMLIIFLHKLEVAGVKKMSVSPIPYMLTGGPGPVISRMAFRLAQLSFSIDYLIGTSYKKHDSNFPIVF